MFPLFLLFTIVPLLELSLLIRVGQLVGFFPTLAIVLGTGIVGAALAKREGLRVFQSWQQALREGRMPEEGVVDGMLILIGGVLLVTPGIITDITGFACVFPASRKIIARGLRRWAKGKIAVSTVRVGGQPGGYGGEYSRSRPANPDIIEAQGETIDVEVID